MIIVRVGVIRASIEVALVIVEAISEVALIIVQIVNEVILVITTVTAMIGSCFFIRILFETNTWNTITFVRNRNAFRQEGKGPISSAHVFIGNKCSNHQDYCHSFRCDQNLSPGSVKWQASSTGRVYDSRT